jgi:hypothetical protein
MSNEERQGAVNSVVNKFTEGLVEMEHEGRRYRLRRSGRSRGNGYRSPVRNQSPDNHPRPTEQSGGPSRRPSILEVRQASPFRPSSVRSHNESARILRKRDDSGVVTIEFVLVIPFLMALIFAIASFGLWFSKQNEVTGAARNVARALALRDPSWQSTPLPPDTSIQSWNVGGVPGATCAAGDTNSVATVQLILPGSKLPWYSVVGVPPSPHDITSTASMRCGG